MNTIPVTASEPVSDTSPIPPIPTETPKKKNYLPWVLGILGLAIVLVTILFIYFGKSKSTVPDSLTQTPVPQEQNTIDATNIDMSSWETYFNPNFGIAFRYPSNWIVSVSDKNSIVTIGIDSKISLPRIEVSSLNKQDYISFPDWKKKADKDCEESKRLSEKTGGPTDCFQYEFLEFRKVNIYASTKVLWSCCGSNSTIGYFIDDGHDKIYVLDLFPENFNHSDNYDEGNGKLAIIYQQILSSLNLGSVKISDTQISVTNTKTGKTTIIDKPKTVHPDIVNRDINSPYYIPAKLADPRFQDIFKDEFDETLWKYSFSPDNSKLAFVDASGIGIQQIAVANLSTQSVEFVTTDSKNTKHVLKQNISWSPDGVKIAFTELDGFGTGAGYDEELTVVDTISKKIYRLGRVAELAKLETPDMAASAGELLWLDNSTITSTANTVNNPKEFTLKIN